MGEAIHIPSAPRIGDNLSAAKMRELFNAVRRNMPIAGAGVRVSHTMGGAVISLAQPSRTIGGAGATRPHLWEVRKSDTDGGFVMWCGEPDTHHMLNYGGDEIAFDGVTASADPELSAAGWKLVENFASGDLWLAFKVGEAGRVPEAKVTTEKETREGWTNYHICKVDVDDETGRAKVWQSLVGELVLCEGSGGGGGGYTTNVKVVTGVEYLDDFSVWTHNHTLVFRDGILQAVNPAPDLKVFDTTPHSLEHS